MAITNPIATTAYRYVIAALNTIATRIRWKRKKKIAGLSMPPVRWTKLASAIQSKMICPLTMRDSRFDPARGIAYAITAL